MIKQIDISNFDEVLSLLSEIKDDFGFSLDDKVAIDEYAEKFLSLAYCLGYYKDGCLVSIIATYCNDFISRKGYVTIVGTRKQYRGQGVTKLLFKELFVHLESLPIEVIDITTSNPIACQLYSKLGFVITQEYVTDSGLQRWEMSKRIKNKE
ncbi:MAG: GNAT family N-acetyltransferase [Rikenellaceae bacterium]